MVLVYCRQIKDGAERNRVIMETIVIQFAISEGLGTGEELDRRHWLEGLIGGALKAQGLGVCDGGQQGAGSAEIFCDVTDVSAALVVIKAVCDEHLPSRITAHLDTIAKEWVVLDPPGVSEFTIWGEGVLNIKLEVRNDG